MWNRLLERPDTPLRAEVDGGGPKVYTSGSTLVGCRGARTNGRGWSGVHDAQGVGLVPLACQTGGNVARTHGHTCDSGPATP